MKSHLNVLSVEFNFSSFPKGRAKDNNFLHVQAPHWPVVKTYARIRN